MMYEDIIHIDLYTELPCPMRGWCHGQNQDIINFFKKHKFSHNDYKKIHAIYNHIMCAEYWLAPHLVHKKFQDPVRRYHYYRDSVMSIIKQTTDIWDAPFPELNKHYKSFIKNKYNGCIYDLDILDLLEQNYYDLKTLSPSLQNIHYQIASSIIELAKQETKFSASQIALPSLLLQFKNILISNIKRDKFK